MCSGKACVFESEPGAARAAAPAGFAPARYQPRDPALSPLLELVRTELATFQAGASERGGGAGLPSFVWREFSGLLSCGDPREGFARVRCPRCGLDFLVGFSCHARGLCPSCGARRMHDTAAHLVDRVLPFVPYRHWVLSFPRWLRPLLARRPALADRALDLFLAAVFRFQRAQARAAGLMEELGTGAIAFLHRAGDSLNLHPHVHAVVPDGVFTRVEGDLVDHALFHPLPAPHDEEILAVAQRLVRQTRRTLEAEGILERDQPDAIDELFRESLSEVGPGSFMSLGHRSRLSALVEGFSLQAGTRIHQNDRQGLERLCRYGSHSNFRPLIVPASPRSRASSHCAQPASEPPTPTSPELPTVLPSFQDAGTFVPEPAPAPRPRYLDWATLLRRVYGPDVLHCPRCQGPLKIIAFIEDKKVVRAIFDHLGISPTGPPLAPARPRAQADLFA